MNLYCPDCKKIGIFPISPPFRWKCPWLDCKYEGEDVIDKITHSALRKVHKINKNNPRLSCIIAYAKSPDPNRDEALNRLMHCFNNQTYQYKNFEIIVVEHVRKKENKGEFPYKQLVDKYIRIVDDRPFNKSWVMNVGAREAKTNNLIFHDADVLFGKSFLQEVVNFIPKHKLFSCWSSFRCMPGRDNPYLRIHTPTTVRCLIGAWYCDKDYYWNTLGGYNEDYFGYGREDSDIWHRATHITGGIPVLDYPLVHYYHHWHLSEGPNPLNRDDKRANAILEECMNNTEEARQMLLKVKDKLGNVSGPILLHDMKYGLDKNCNGI